MKPLLPEHIEQIIQFSPSSSLSDSSVAASFQAAELLTKLLISRNSAEEKKMVAFLRKGEGFSWSELEELLTQRMRVWHTELQRVDEGQEAEDQVIEMESAASSKAARGSKKRQRGSSPSQDLSSSSSSSSTSAPHYTGFDFSVFNGENPLSSLSYSELSPYQRLLLLKALCDYHLSVSPDFQSTVRDVLPRDCRIDPLGVDYTGHRYFYFGFPDYRIYREDAINPNKPRAAPRKRKQTQTETDADADMKMETDEECVEDHSQNESVDEEAEKHTTDDDGDDDGKKEEEKKTGSVPSPQQNGHKSKKKTAQQNGAAQQQQKKKETDTAAAKAHTSTPPPPEGYLADVLSLSLPSKPAFRLLSFSADSLQQLIKWLARGHRKDKAVSVSLCYLSGSSRW